MNDQWEYKLLTGHGLLARYDNNLKDENGDEYGQLSEDMLNQLGKEGWEVCSYNFSSVSPVTLILKRRIAPR